MHPNATKYQWNTINYVSDWFSVSTSTLFNLFFFFLLFYWSSNPLIFWSSKTSNLWFYMQLSIYSCLMLYRIWRCKGYVPEQIGDTPVLPQSSFFFFFFSSFFSSFFLNADYRGEGGAMDGEGRSQTDYYTIRVSNPSSSGEAYFIVSAIAVYTYSTVLSCYTYITQYITWVCSHF